MKKKRYFVKDAWTVFPEDLQELFVHAFFSNADEYVLPGVIKYISDRRPAVEHGIIDKRAYLQWVDRLFADLLMSPFLEDVWWENLDTVGALLSCADELLTELEPEARKLPRTENDLRQKEVSPVVLAQDLSLYTAVYASLRKDQKLLQEAVSRCVEYTETNLRYILAEDKDTGALLDKHEAAQIIDYYYPGSAFFVEPLEWLYHGHLYGDLRECLISAFDDYISFLADFPCSDKKRPLVDKLLADALSHKISLAYDAREAADDEISILQDSIDDLEEKSESYTTIIKECDRQLSALQGKAENAAVDSDADCDDCPF